MMILVFALPAETYAQQPPLASGGAPTCSQKMGRRRFRSTTAWDAGSVAFITASALRNRNGCYSDAEIQLEYGTKAKTIALPDAARQDFAIVDFSPDGKQLLVSAATREKNPDPQFRYLQIASLPISSSQIRWRNVWDVLGWKDCDATVEPLGFTSDGKIALRARPSVMASSRRPHCVSSPRLYAIDPESAAASSIAASARITRYGKVVSSASQTCKSDPDLVGKCFAVQGKMSAWNGNPTFRISPTGTNRILGVTDAPFPPSQPQLLPESLAGKVTMDANATGDFFVCPFTAEKSGHMQMVCVESATNLTFKRR